MSSIPTRALGPDALAVGAIGYGEMSFATPYGQEIEDADRTATEIVDRSELEQAGKAQFGPPA